MDNHKYIINQFYIKYRDIQTLRHHHNFCIHQTHIRDDMNIIKSEILKGIYDEYIIKDIIKLYKSKNEEIMIKLVK